MKKTLILAGTLAGSLFVNAQTSKVVNMIQKANGSSKTHINQSPSDLRTQFKTGGLKNPNQLANNNSAAQRPSAIKKRLIGRSVYYEGLMEDTMYLKYSGTRTSTFRDCYENITPEAFFYNPIKPFLDPFNPANAVDSNNQAKVAADTVLRLADWGSGFEPLLTQFIKFDSATGRIAKFFQEDEMQGNFLDADSFAYDNAGRTKSFVGFEDGELVYKVHKTFNTAGAKTVDSLELNYGGMWLPYMSLRYSYTSANVLNKIELYVLDEQTTSSMIMAGKAEISNNSMGLPDTIKYYELDYNTMQMLPSYDGRQTYKTYDASGRVVTQTEFYTEPLYVDYSSKDSFSYTGANTLYNYNANFYWSTDSSKLVKSFVIQAHLNSANNWDTVLISELDWNTNTLELYERAVIGYNTDDLVLNFKSYEWTGTAFSTTPYSTANYYYEDYDDGVTSINNRFKNASFTVYPNPTSNVINVGNLEQKVNLTLYNIDGKKIMQANNATQLNLQNVAAGSYWLRVTNQNNEVIGSQQVIKK